MIVTLAHVVAWYERQRDRPTLTGPGIDVSHHQGKIDWFKVRHDLRHDGEEPWVYIKATEGRDYVDPMFFEHARGARLAGVAAGAYHFARMDSGDDPVVDARAEVNDFLYAIDARWLDLPPCLDIELGGIKRREPAWCRDWWAAAIEYLLAETGEWPMIYTGRWTLRWIFGKDAPTHTRCQLWWAEYTNGTKPRHTRDDWSPTIWQHTSKGRVAGIRGRVDRNIVCATS